MNGDTFENDGLCDGAFCVIRDDCARFTGNVGEGHHKDAARICHRLLWDGPCDHFKSINDNDYTTEPHQT